MGTSKPVSKNNKESGKYESLHALVEKAVQGDNDARAELCEQIADKVLFRMKYLLGNNEHAEDATQDILFYVWKNIGNLRNPKAFNAWLGKIIVNQKNKHFTQNAAQKEHLHIDDLKEQLAEDNVASLPYELAESNELRKVISDTLKDLPIRQRESIILHYYDGLNVSEISEAMGVSQQFVSKSLASARNNIKNILTSHPTVSEHVGASSAVPIAALLTKTLKDESTNFIIDDTLMQYILSRVGESSISTTPSPYSPYIDGIAQNASTTASTAGGLSHIFSKRVLVACVATIIAATVTFGVLIYNRHQHSERYTPEQVSILFHGGISSGNGVVHLNPEQAEISSPDMSVQRWDISTRYGTLVHHGEGNTASYGLQMLRESELSGEFVLNMWLESNRTENVLHHTGINFYIQN